MYTCTQTTAFRAVFQDPVGAKVILHLPISSINLNVSLVDHPCHELNISPPDINGLPAESIVPEQAPKLRGLGLTHIYKSWPGFLPFSRANCNPPHPPLTIWDREYWMIYRLSGFLAIVRIGSSVSTCTPSPVRKLDRRHTERLRKRDNLLIGEGGMGWARGQITRPQESLVLYKSFNTLWYRTSTQSGVGSQATQTLYTAIYCCIKAYLCTFCTTGAGIGSAFNLSYDSGLLLLKQEHERPALFFKSSFRHLVELRSTVL